jgi:LuxR family maltose regulon positive regulatory protein
MSTSYLIEALTPRELTIVELLPTHLSYVQIGQQLFVSVNTVKSNLKSIYRKLGVSNRFEAVAVARQLGLIAPAPG